MFSSLVASESSISEGAAGCEDPGSGGQITDSLTSFPFINTDMSDCMLPNDVMQKSVVTSNTVNTVFMEETLLVLCSLWMFIIVLV